ncbi:LPXTG cell wall anchor domain-containing protein OS=Streptomyces tendae OX=1932 GN=F3L20_22450 PE=4 SV=1 [Streptomyces tendae]
MRSARMVLAAATATAALAIAAPAAYADHDGDSGHDSSSYSEDYGKESKYDKDEKDDKYDKPHGGVHAGGGALSAVSGDDWGTAKDPKYDPETYKEKDDSESEDSWSGKQDKEWKHDKPHGGVHTGGGGLASEPGCHGGRPGRARGPRHRHLRAAP